MPPYRLQLIDEETGAVVVQWSNMPPRAVEAAQEFIEKHATTMIQAKTIATAIRAVADLGAVLRPEPRQPPTIRRQRRSQQ